MHAQDDKKPWQKVDESGISTVNTKVDCFMLEMQLFEAHMKQVMALVAKKNILSTYDPNLGVQFKLGS